MLAADAGFAGVGTRALESKRKPTKVIMACEAGRTLVG